MATAHDQFVAERAGHRCEYCHLPAVFLRMKFVSDHIIARKHDGTSDPENLAYACPHCNSFKLDNIAGLDLPSHDIVRLFNPRRDLWDAHFHWEDASLIGITSIGRATIRVLNINEPQRRLHRAVLMAEGISFD
jgi:hypothetical protein